MFRFFKSIIMNIQKLIISSLCTVNSVILDSNPDRYRTVKKIADLRKCFDKISIAEGDKLFLGKKEILPDDAPDIFAIYQKKQQANLNL